MSSLLRAIGQLFTRVDRRQSHAGAPGPDASPLSRDADWPAAELARRRRALAKKGIRAWPYPFASGLAIVSDCDGSTRHDYEGYRATLVERLGLDFGDSCRLMERTRTNRLDGLCFFDYDAAPSAPSASGDALGFDELVHEARLGNLDHYHFFSGVGPRLVRLVVFDRPGENGRWRAAVPRKHRRGARKSGSRFNLRGNHLPVRIVVVQARAALPERTRVCLRPKDGDPIVLERIEPAAGGSCWAPRFSAHAAPPAFYAVPAGEPVPLSAELRHVDVEPPPGAEVELEAVGLLNVWRPDLVRMMDELAGRCGFRPSLITDHGSRFLVNDWAFAAHAAASRDCARTHLLAGLSSRVAEEDVYYSTLGDDPESFAYLLPDLRDRWGVRFVNPGGGSSEPAVHLDLLNLVVPSRARDGTTIYVARRCLPPLDGAVLEGRDALENDHGTRSFPHRLAWVLDACREHPEAAYPIYTHLGNIRPKEDRPERFFDEPPLHALQDRYFGISSGVEPRDRVMVTRATLLYDYALILRSIAAHVTRDGDAIEIASWHDPVLDRRLPESVEQLNGLTFHVDDPVCAQVTLDGRPVEALARHAASVGERASVTIVGVGSRHVVDAGEALCIGADIAVTRRRMAPALHPVGTQYLAWRVRADGPARTAIVVRTTSGATFRFGDLDEAAPEATAWCAPPGASVDGTLVMASFHDLTWAHGLSAPCPVPSHPIASLELCAAGEPGTRVTFSDIAFVRPGASPARAV